MRIITYAVVIASLLIFCAPNLYSQEHDMHGPNAPQEKQTLPQPGGAMGGMMGHEGMGMIRHEGRPMKGHEEMGIMMHNPRLAGLMMQMRGETMRIRGEALMKEGDVLRRYGERLQKEGATKEAAKTSTK